MGLDMIALAITETPNREVDFEVGEDAEQLCYWRKHPNLHGWMEALYREKGGTAFDFNCVALALTGADLDHLESAIRHNALPQTTGFFFGASDGSETEGDLAFVSAARKAQAEGKTVVYTSWW